MYVSICFLLSMRFCLVKKKKKMIFGDILFFDHLPPSVLVKKYGNGLQNNESTEPRLESLHLELLGLVDSQFCRRY